MTRWPGITQDDLPADLRSETVVIDGERYVRVRTVYAALELAHMSGRRGDFVRRRRGLRPHVHWELASHFVERVFGGFTGGGEPPSALPEAAADFTWARPFRRRCRARLRRGIAAQWYWGRCDLVAGHTTDHALERGMEIVTWPRRTGEA